MNTRLKYFLTVFLRFFLKIFYLFPIKKNRIIFVAFEGKQYSDSPKYIYEEIKQNDSADADFQYIWVLNDPKNIYDNIITVPYQSIKFFYYMLTSKIIVNNQLTINYIPFRKKQTVIGTWHGGGAYKKCQLDVIDNKIERKYTKLISQNVNWVLSSCQAFSSAFKTAYLLKDDMYINSGLPRNDILINKNKNYLYDKIKSKYNIPKNDKIALYAPTFRSAPNMPTASFIAGNFNLDIKRLKNALSKKYSGNWHVMFRAHPKLSQIKFDSNVIDVSNYKDMQELLYVSDVLINDYSSSMWDFSFTKKPIFIYAEDLKNYTNNRDFYTPISKWPFSIAKNNDELERNILEFNQEEYNEKLDKHHKDLGSFEKGVASRMISELIFNILERK